MLKKAKGYRGRRSKLFRYAKDAVMKAQFGPIATAKLASAHFVIFGSNVSTPPHARTA